MNRFPVNRFWIVAAMLGIGVGIVSTARAAEDVASPRYAAWAKFKPGSSATLTADMKMGPQKIEVHTDMKQVLVSVTAEAAEIEATSTTQYMGHTTNPTPIKRTVPAKEPAKEYKDGGTKDVEAMGKTFSCKVMELTGDSAAALAPKSGRGPANASATLYVNSDVPGGIVKMELHSADGKTDITFKLTAMEAK